MPAGTKTFLRQKTSLASSENGHTRNGGSDRVANDLNSFMVPKNSSDQSIVRLSKQRTEAIDIQGLSHHAYPSVCSEFDFSGAPDDESPVLNTSHMTGEKSRSSLKINESTTGNGVLRYALHLCFMCPDPKKSSRSVQRCKCDPLSAPEGKNIKMEPQRRFYLYSDLKVVFPQRHSDSDEGKLNVDHHFPVNPKYFDI